VTGAAPTELGPILASGLVTFQPTDRLRLGVLVSGQGTNLQAILDAEAAGQLPATVVAVACNHDNVPAIERSRAIGVQTEVFPHAAFGKRAARDAAITAFLLEHRVDLVILAGYDRFLAPIMLETFRNRMINIHPSLLPAFGGTLNAQAEALQHGVKLTGCTVFFVNDVPDGGPIILQAAVPVEEGDSVDTLRARILAEEHRILPEAIRLIAAGRVIIDGRYCRILPR
jgi:phosphoribosylglycinamide formyltransferase-1